jgi:hypothetical protein
MAHDAGQTDRPDRSGRAEPASPLGRLAMLLSMVPRWILYLALILVVFSWVPFAVVTVSRTTLDSAPPYHFFQDMDVQPRLKAQAADATFADRRAMRPPIEGTVARGELKADDHFHRGYRTDPNGQPVTRPGPDDPNSRVVAYARGYPDRVTVDRPFLERGQDRYNIFCAPCHGASGRGDGMVHKRALATGATRTGWVQPTNFAEHAAQSTYGAEAYPNGKLFNIISHGIRTMPGYAGQIPERDRWAIVAYVRALQLSQNARVEDITAEQRRRLR